MSESLSLSLTLSLHLGDKSNCNQEDSKVVARDESGNNGIEHLEGPLRRLQSPFLFEFFECGSIYNQSPAVVYDDGLRSGCEVLTHGNLKYFSKRIYELVGERLALNRGFVGVVMEQNCLLPAVILGILQAGCGFYCMDFQTDFKEQLIITRQLNMKYIIADPEFEKKHPTIRKYLETSHPYSYQSQDDHFVHLNIYTLKRGQEEKPNVEMKPYEWAYAIKTSGTTDSRKIVLVSHSSISPNIQDLKERWKLTKDDIFFGASPITFDPHVVELFLALASFAKIVYVPRWFKLSPEVLSKVLVTHKITILQCTPSLLMRFSQTELGEIFAIGSPLRVLALGGEPFVNKDFLRSVVPVGKEQSMMMFNLYGLTEMSCWSSMTQIYFDDTPPHITTLLTDSGFSFCQELDGDISLFATTIGRLCKVLRECDGEILPTDVRAFGGLKTYFLPTGDIVETNDPGEPPCVIYRGRNDMRMKRFGRFVDLVEIEERTEATNLVNLALSFDYIGKIYLIVQFKDQENTTAAMFLTELRKYVDFRSYPDHVLLVLEVPLTDNGKIDVKRIKDAVSKRVEVPTTIELPSENQFQIEYKDEDVIEMLKHEWDMYTYAQNPESQSSSSRENFFQAGGDSMSAMQFTESIFVELNQFGTSLQHELSPVILNILTRKLYTDLELYVLSHVCKMPLRTVGIWSLDSILTESYHANSTEQNDEAVGDKSATTIILDGSEAIPTMLTCGETKIPVAIRRHWKFNLYGCNDSTPVIVGSKAGPLVITTSNSGRVHVVNLLTLNAVAPGNAEKAVLWWKKLPDRIVCSAAVHPDKEFIVISCCDGNLYALNISTGNVKWVQQHRSRTILRSTPVFSRHGSRLYLTSDSDLLLRINFEDGRILQDKYLERAVGRLTPLLVSFPYEYPSKQYSSLFVTTYGSIKKINIDPFFLEAEDEIKIESSNISAIMVELESKKLIVYEQCAGTLAASALEEPDDDLEPVWKIKLDANPRSRINSPISYEMDDSFHIIICTTTLGKLHVVNAEMGEVLANLDLDGETNSTPTLVSANKNNLLLVVSMRKEGLKFVQINFPVEPDKNFRLEIVGTLKVDGKNSECFSSVAAYGNTLVVGSRDDYVHFLELANC